jgi:glycogen synthase
MRVLIVPSSYPPVLGGVQTVAHNLARDLAQQGHAVRVMTNRYPRSLTAREELDGVTVERRLFLTPSADQLRRHRFDLFAASLWYSPGTRLAIERLMKDFAPTVVNVHYPDSQVPFVRRLRRRRDFRLVVSLHGYEVERWFGIGETVSPKGLGTNPGARQTGQLHDLLGLLRDADAITACSRYLANLVSRLEPSIAGKTHVVYNDIDLDRFRDRTIFPHPRPYVLAYGRLTRQKGFDMLIAAFAELTTSFPNVDLVLAGDGEDRETLETQARGLGLIGRVYFYGRATPDQIVHLLNGCRLAVVPSRWEPFGIVALEAMAAGKTVVATRVGGLPEFVDDTTNVLVEPNLAGLRAGLGEALRELGGGSAEVDENRQLAAMLAKPRSARDYLNVFEEFTRVR